MGDTIYSLTTKKMAKKAPVKEGKKPFVPFWLNKGTKKGAVKAAKGRMKK
jgi:hypothetical protein